MKNIYLALAILFITTSCNENIINSGKGGDTCSDLLNRVDNDVLKYDPDIVILMIGTNDMLNSQSFVSFDNYRDSLTSLVSRIKEKNIELVLVSPPPCDTTYLFERHDKNQFELNPNCKMSRLNKIIKTVAFQNDVHFVSVFDLFNHKEIPQHNRDKFIRNISNSGAKDGVHPTKFGYELIANFLYTYLKDNFQLTSGTKIVCFGDSITFGVHVRGEGTSKGDTYPAFIMRSINRLKHH
ncbi:SGNH/GDSL hydrolase family protein [Carboxylicivirga marina]|uniref:SGNH/GDSL hydrolase family protein n=1 Tax=Carboxylicivirga marina TaxID=2800988 RepID=UPI00259528EC|nr:GDSL-type esterase/lipase family protein [uncultured Carboxylicivirga sp.]